MFQVGDLVRTKIGNRRIWSRNSDVKELGIISNIISNSYIPKYICIYWIIPDGRKNSSEKYYYYSPKDLIKVETE
jgi:hypothetical protein